MASVNHGHLSFWQDRDHLKSLLQNASEEQVKFPLIKLQSVLILL